MIEIKIKNLRNEKPSAEWQVKVDRSSVLGNPFYMADESKRDEVCDKYAVYFKNKISLEDNAFMTELRRLYRIAKRYGKLELFCWCAPKRCHAETIREFLNKYLNKGE